MTVAAPYVNPFPPNSRAWILYNEKHWTRAQSDQFIAQELGFLKTHASPTTAAAAASAVTNPGKTGKPGTVTPPTSGTGSIAAGGGGLVDTMLGFDSTVLNAVGGVFGTGNPVGDIANAGAAPVTGAKAGVDAFQAIGDFLSNPIPGLVTAMLVIGGAVLIYSGLGKMLGFDTPVRSSARAAVDAGVVVPK